MLARLQDISEEARTLFGRYAVVWIGAAIESPAGSVTPLPL
jgi:hypothetical protein